LALAHDASAAAIVDQRRRFLRYLLLFDKFHAAWNIRVCFIRIEWPAIHAKQNKKGPLCISAALFRINPAGD
jgi:lysozyme family protein